MKGNNSMILNPKEALEIVELVKTERRRLDLGMGSIGEKIFSVFRDNNIQLLYFALEPKHPNSLAAFYLEKHCSVTGIRSYYIAINSMVPLDLQIFNSCHEYYHHIDEIDENLHLRRFGDSDDLLINAKANRFAAEFLLPTETLSTYVKKHEIDSINKHVKKELLSIDERDSQSSYYKIGSTLNSHVFHKLNSITDKIGVEPEALNVILQNYDEGITTIDSTVKDLNIFNKK
ncbi:ImmA/IrrE family metallo-endopeptidase [Tepidibacillus infernus]|uniref:ImmA/IrrE family metallo-endopeptidase n=1 Tax=Tepidibacillus infernus TaxID=1806172 RepID=UPI003B74EF61